MWRYSRVDELDLDDFEPLAGSTGSTDSAVPAGARTVLDALTDRAGAVVTRNGTVVSVELDEAVAAAGVRLGLASDLDGSEALLDSVAGDATDAFGILNRAFASDPIVLHVPRNQVVAAPVVVIHWFDDDADNRAVFPHLVVRAEENSEVRVLEWYGSDDIAALVVPVVELDADRAARLRYLAVQDLGPRVWQIGTQTSQAHADAFVATSQAALAGDYARPVRLPPGGAGRHRRPPRRLLRRGRPDARLPHLPGPRRPRHHQRTCSSRAPSAGRSRSVYTGPHPGPARRPGAPTPSRPTAT